MVNPANPIDDPLGTAGWDDERGDDRLSQLVRDASRAFTRAIQERLARHGIPYSYWAFLRVLWKSDGMTQKELSERAGLMANTTFSAMRTMEAEGYIVRSQLPTNKKNVYVHLTREGRALQKKLLPVVDEPNVLCIEGLSRAEVQVARRVLIAMIDSLARDESFRARENPPAAATRRPRAPAA